MDKPTQRRGVLREFAAFAWEYKLFWMIPIGLVVIVVGALLLAGYADAPFLYVQY